MPANTILFPGIFPLGLAMKAAKLVPSQTNPAFFTAGEYWYPPAAPVRRPTNPLSSGPNLFFAPGPTARQACHLPNDTFPVALSCAAAIPGAARKAAANMEYAASRFTFHLPSPESIRTADFHLSNEGDYIASEG